MGLGLQSECPRVWLNFLTFDLLIKKCDFACSALLTVSMMNTLQTSQYGEKTVRYRTFWLLSLVQPCALPPFV